MQKADHPGQPRARLLIDQLNTLRFRPVELALDIVGLEAHMMQSAAAPGEEFRDAAVEVYRLEQLDLALAHLEQGGAHTLLFDRRALGQAQSQSVAPELESRLQVRHDHSHMMNPLEHRVRYFCRQIFFCSLSHRESISFDPSVGCSERVDALLLHAPAILPC